MTNSETPAWDDIDLTFHFDTGRLSLNFTATVGDRADQAFDRWQDEDDLSRWLTDAKIAPQGTKIDKDAFNTARELREAIYRTAYNRYRGHTPRSADIELINHHAAQPPLAPQLNDTATASDWCSETGIIAALSMIARDAIGLFASADIERLRECAEETCSVLFIDTSRPGKRRWCSMTRCGNRAKKKAFRERQRAS